MSMKDLKNKRIALFFAYNVSLKIWNDLGMISRESKIWHIFGKNFAQVYFITYGNKEENKFMGYFPNIKLLNNRWHLNKFFYSLILPLLYRKELKKVDIYKVNQISGALPAVISKILFKKRLVVRCGFQLSLFFKKQKESILKVVTALILEKIAYNFADLVILTSPEDKEYAIRTHKINPAKITIFPNGIDTELFKIMPDVEENSGRILFVGRLIWQKNLFSLLEASRGIGGIHLVIIGRGPLKADLRRASEKWGINIEFLDSVNNDCLPLEYNKAEIFVLPSLFEGNPKVLLEAMACGRAIVASDICGINNIVKNRITGILCSPEAFSIRAALSQILRDKQLGRTIGQNARRYSEENFNLRKLIEDEVRLTEDIL